MDKELQEQLNIIIENMATKGDVRALHEKLDMQGEHIDKLEGRFDDLTGIMLNFENNMNTRIESLFDGYKLNHEKQWELERKVDEIEQRLMALEIRALK